MKRIPLTLLALLSLLAACSHKNSQDDALYKEAATYHNEGIAIHNEVMSKLNEVDSVQKLLATKTLALKADAQKAGAKADTTALSRAKTALAALSLIDPRMDEWMGNIVEVPGNEHEHHHEEGHGEHEHHHDHAPAPAITAQQMLDVQKAGNEAIRTLQADMDTALIAAKAALSAK